PLRPPLRSPRPTLSPRSPRCLRPARPLRLFSRLPLRLQRRRFPPPRALTKLAHRAPGQPASAHLSPRARPPPCAQPAGQAVGAAIGAAIGAAPSAAGAAGAAAVDVDPAAATPWSLCIKSCFRLTSTPSAYQVAPLVPQPLRSFSRRDFRKLSRDRTLLLLLALSPSTAASSATSSAASSAAKTGGNPGPTGLRSSINTAVGPAA
ncbi:unnamed protein product, partial [Closterium sp. NIES-53]